VDKSGRHTHKFRTKLVLQNPQETVAVDIWADFNGLDFSLGLPNAAHRAQVVLRAITCAKTSERVSLQRMPSRKVLWNKILDNYLETYSGIV